MSDHTDVRLETPGGDVVAYLAPETAVQPAGETDLTRAEMTPSLDTPVVVSHQTVLPELVVTGVLEHSANLPSAHQSALDSVFGSLPVTPRDQVRRLKGYIADPDEGGPFYFYDGADSYDVDAGGTVDWSGSYPTVQVRQLRTRSLGGTETSRMEYTLRLLVGWQTPSGNGDQIIWTADNVSEPLVDVEMTDTMTKRDTKATVTVRDPDGTAASNYDKGSEVVLKVSDDGGVTTRERFRGAVFETDHANGQLTLNCISLDHLLFETFSHEFVSVQLKDILQTLIEDYTPILWDENFVSVSNNRTLTRRWQGYSVNAAITEIAALDGGANWGVRANTNLFGNTGPLQNVFFYDTEGADSAPQDFTDGDWHDYEVLEDYKPEVNKVVVYYGPGGDTNLVTAEDSTSQSTLANNIGVSDDVERVLSKYYPSIPDETIAQDIADALLDGNNERQAVELETWDAFDVYPNQTAQVEIPERGIDDTYVIDRCEYAYQQDRTRIRLI